MPGSVASGTRDIEPDRLQMTIQYGVEKMQLSCQTTKVYIQTLT